MNSKHACNLTREDFDGEEGRCADGATAEEHPTAEEVGQTTR